MEHEFFWIRVKKLLKTNKVSRSEFAQYVGINPHTFRNWMFYHRIPDACSACSMAEALGVTVEYLVRGSDNPKTDFARNRSKNEWPLLN